MKHLNLVLFFFVVALAAGCGKSSTNNNAVTPTPSRPSVTPPLPSPAATQPLAAAPSPVASNAPAALPHLEPVIYQEAKPLPQDLNDFTYAQKGDFIQKMMAARDELNAEIRQLSAKIDRADPAIKSAVVPKMNAVRTKLNQLDAVMDKAMVTPESTWDQEKVAAKDAYEDTRQAVQDAGVAIDNKVSS